MILLDYLKLLYRRHRIKRPSKKTNNCSADVIRQNPSTLSQLSPCINNLEISQSPITHLWGAADRHPGRAETLTPRGQLSSVLITSVFCSAENLREALDAYKDLFETLAALGDATPFSIFLFTQVI